MFYKKRYEEAIKQNKRNADTIRFLQIHVDFDILKTSNDIATGRKDANWAIYQCYAEMSMKKSAEFDRRVREYQKEVKKHSDAAAELTAAAMSSVDLSAKTSSGKVFPEKQWMLAFLNKKTKNFEFVAKGAETNVSDDLSVYQYIGKFELDKKWWDE